MPSFFSTRLLQWHRDHPRPLPWDDGPRDPYHIWISEVVMQQTRIEQGGPYYQRFIARFPDVAALANAPLDDVLRYWEGLGYYTRARNLHAAAKKIVAEFNSRFPDTYDDVLSLPGIGPYSASAIVSFAYAVPYPVVDGNVKRVLSRFEGIQDSIDDAKTTDIIRSHAAKHMNGNPPGEFNQAIMNFGALVCKPKSPLCTDCPVSIKCVAFRHELTDIIPVRSKKRELRERFFHFLVLQYKDQLLFLRRSGKDIWNGLYTPPKLERQSLRAPAASLLHTAVRELVGHDSFVFEKKSATFHQLLSHQKLNGRFYFFKIKKKPRPLSEDYAWLSKSDWEKVGKPKMINDWLKREH